MARTLSRRSVLRPDRLIWFLLLLLLAERLLLFRQFGPDYLSGADDVNYLPAGVHFAETGVISYGSDYPSALIMPGMPVLLGLVSALFGAGAAYRIAARVLWCLFGTATAWYVYRAGRLCLNGWAGLLAACWFLLPNMAWMNHVILTETPYILFSSMCVFYTLAMERRGERRWFVGYLLSFLLALMFRSNILIMPVFTALWLLFRRADRRLLLRRGLILAAALLLLLTPWTIRNARLFGAFVPLTYGAGQPLLQGTYQGEGYPADEALDYETNVHRVMREEYAAYYRDEAEPRDPETSSYYAMLYDPDGEVLDLKNAQYLSMQSDGVKARYRLREWWESAPGSLLKSYLYIKPRWQLNWAWAWEEAFGVSYGVLHRISQLNMLLCALTVPLALRLRRARAPVLFLSALYLLQLYIHALAFVTDRYASSLLFLRYILAGIGLCLLAAAPRRLREGRKTGPERSMPL